MKTQLSPQDWQQLSAYLDGQLSTTEKERLETRLRSQSEIVRVPYEKVYGPGFEDMFRRVPSLAKLERLIAYRPRTSLETIIDAVAGEMRAHSHRSPVSALGEQLVAPAPQPA